MYTTTPSYDQTPAAVAGILGLGCAGCGGSCGCSEGLGLFDSGLDFSQWGGVEWTLVAVGAYAFFSMMSTTKRAVHYGSQGTKRAVRAAKRAVRKRTKRTKRAVPAVEGSF